MMKIYIDITNLMQTEFLTGIQRVVREILLRMVKEEKYDIVLLSYLINNECYEIIDKNEFVSYFGEHSGESSSLRTSTYMSFREMENGSVFFDIDSVWNARLKRSYLYPMLKDRGVRIVTQVYDVIPVTHPQFSHYNTRYNFMNYLAAVLEFSDMVIVNAKATLDKINELARDMGIEEKKGIVVPLGADFKKKGNSGEEVDEEVAKKAAMGKYILMVGTIEPRKNHKLVLDAFDKKLKDTGINVIFAGRSGWNIDKLMERIENHPEYNKRIFHIEGANDVTIDHLYKNAFAVAFPTFNEGFGLPVIESIQRGTPVIASDIAVLREVGGEFCDYFKLDDADAFIEAVEKNLADEKAYEEKKNRLKEYKTFTWDMSAEKMGEVLLSMENNNRKEEKDVKQIVMLSARYADLSRSLPYIEKFMPFITELVLCCPDFMKKEMQEKYKGRLNVIYLTDDEVLNGRELPKDHTYRNFFLRCLAMEKDEIDDVFIMSDDDYRPLMPTDKSVFVKDGVYSAYYCYMLGDWGGNPNGYTSFDLSMMRSYEYLSKIQYPSRMYSSHAPQIIDKRIFREMLADYEEIKDLGLCDWSMYFNYGSYKYPKMYDIKPYVTMGWPALPSDWELQVKPPYFLFENFYDVLYENGRVFDGFPKELDDNVLNDNIKKVGMYMNLRMKHEITNGVNSTY
ncbi:MAG: glycosyltransferase, partial [Firmicutes bacterium]|nr:glycosyltransferase [Bacillota bacterium]